MNRNHFEPEHVAFGESVRTFLDKEVLPNYDQYEAEGITPREIFTKAGANGFLGMAVPDPFGGGGTSDFRFNQAMDEAIAASGAAGTGLGLSLHNDICLPYFLSYTTDEQKQRWLPGIASGELITAVAMTEPGAGSDLAGIRTSAVRDGDEYVVNGAKTFITNGINADLVITVTRTSPDRHKGLTLLILERGMPGFERGRNLAKMGLHAQDTAELSFHDVRVPVRNVIGEEGRAFYHLVAKLPQERLSIAIGGLGEARAAFDRTLAYVKDRQAFGQPVGQFQNSRFALAEMSTEIEIGQAFVDNCVDALNAGTLSAEDASRAKWWCTELQGRVIDRCVQLFGGYGYMNEYPISRSFVDARITRIYGGTTEIMKEMIGRSLGL